MTANPSTPTRQNSRNWTLTPLLACVFLLPALLVVTSAPAATNSSAIWTGGGGANQTWSSAANWATGAGLAAPPHNPMTPHQLTLGNGAGDIDFATASTPATSTANVDVPWKIAVLFIGNNKNVNLYGQDLTIQQACLGGSTLSLASGAIQVQRNNSGLAKTVNITNNIIFDDSFYQIDTNFVGHSLLQNNGNTTFNFYGHVSNPGSNSWMIFRSTTPITFHGGLSASLTPNAADPNIGLWNVNIAMLNPSAAVAPIVSFPKANNSWKYMDVDRGTIVIGTNDALPTASWFWFGDTPGRPVIFQMNDWNQTFERVFDTEGPATQARSIETGIGAGGTLTINDVGTSNNWGSIVMTGNGRLIKNGSGYLAFERTQTYLGGTTINGGTLRLGTGGAGGLVDGTANIVNNGTLIINSTDPFTLNGSLTGSGGLQKLSSGATTLSGVVNYAGSTTVAGGSLTIGASGNISPSPNITLSGGATLDISATTGLIRGSGQSLDGSGAVSGTVSASPGSSMTVGNSAGTLSLGGAVSLDTTTLNIELSSDPTTVGSGVNDLLSVGGTLTLANVSAINVTPLGALSTATPYKIIQYGALSGLPSNFTAALPYAGRYTFTVQDAPPYIQLAVTATLNGNLLWRGGNPGDPTRWDVATTTNWLNGANPDAYLINDPVAFDDTAVTNRATLAANVTSPSLVASNNSLSYTIDGSGSLTVANLSMQGNGSLTIANSVANNLGNVTMNAGTLIVSNSAGNTFGNVGLTNNTLAIANAGNNAFASIGMGGGIFNFNQPTNATLSTAIVGAAGTVIKEGANTLTVAANNSGFTGAIQINGGVLKTTANHALGDGVAVINNGGSLEFNHPSQNTLSVGIADVTVQGSGAGPNGAIYSSGAYQAFALTNITLSGNASFGGGWETIGGTFTGAGFKVTKVGSGAPTFGTNDCYIGSMSDTDIGDIEVQSGLFGFENLGTTMGRPANTATVRSNAAFILWACLTAGDKNFVMDDGSRFLAGGGGNASMFGGTMNLNGTVHAGFLSANSSVTFNGTLTGSGDLSLDTTGTFVLNGQNTQTGKIIVTNGALRVTSSTALGTNVTVEIRTNGVSGAGVIVGNAVPRVELAGGVVIPPGVTIHMNSNGSTNDNRTAFGVALVSTDESQATIIPHGDGTCALFANNAASLFTQSGPYSNMNFTGTLNLRGSGNGFVSGRVTIGGNMTANSGGTGLWTISSTGNQWAQSAVYSSRLILATNDALCVTAPLWMGGAGNLDLGGFNHTISGIVNDGVATGVIANSSTTSDSLLTINGATNITTITNTIVDSIAGGTMKVAVTISNTTVRLFGANTYTGPTLVKNGATLGGSGSLASAVTVESGGSLSPGASIGAMTINNTLTLNAGSTSIMEVSHTPAANDGILGLSSVTYGGTLVITNINVAPLAAGDSFLLFQAGAYNGNFSSLQLPTLDAGLVWNTNNLSVNGTLSVVATAPPHVDTVSRLPDGNVQLTLSGPSGANYSIYASTNVALPLSNWSVINNGTISTSPFTYNDLSATNFTRRFYRMSVP